LAELVEHRGRRGKKRKRVKSGRRRKERGQKQPKTEKMEGAREEEEQENEGVPLSGKQNKENEGAGRKPTGCCHSCCALCWWWSVVLHSACDARAQALPPGHVQWWGPPTVLE